MTCGQSLAVTPAGGRTFPAESTRVLLVLDQKWRERFGDDAETSARLLLAQVSGLFKGLHIHLLVVGIEAWAAPVGAGSAEALLHAAQGDIDPGPSDIVIVLTGRTLFGSDGWAEVGGRFALVSHHPDRPERDAFVLAHEVAHVFGANHGCDLPAHEGVMAAEGFAEPLLICPCTRQILEANALRFHGESSAPADRPTATPSRPSRGLP